jgi:hypothetical protein
MTRQTEALRSRTGTTIKTFTKTKKQTDKHRKKHICIGKNRQAKEPAVVRHAMSLVLAELQGNNKETRSFLRA